MKEETKNHLYNALLNASALILQHSTNGGDPDEFDCIDEDDLEKYQKQCKKASKLINTLAKKYKL